MPKKNVQESQEEQADRFKREAERLIDAGELSPEDGEKALDTLVRRQSENPPTKQ